MSVENGQNFFAVVSGAIASICFGWLGLRRIIRTERLGDASNEAELKGIKWVSDQLDKATERATEAEQRADEAVDELNQVREQLHKERSENAVKVNTMEMEIAQLVSEIIDLRGSK